MLAKCIYGHECRGKASTGFHVVQDFSVQLLFAVHSGCCAPSSFKLAGWLQCLHHQWWRRKQITVTEHTFLLRFWVASPENKHLATWWQWNQGTHKTQTMQLRKTHYIAQYWLAQWRELPPVVEIQLAHKCIFMCYNRCRDTMVAPHCFKSTSRPQPTTVEHSALVCR